MSKELNERLKEDLLEVLTKYLPTCKESLVRNKHMHDFDSAGSLTYGPHVMDKFRTVLTGLIQEFTNSYTGGGRLTDVVDWLVVAAKRSRAARFDGPMDQVVWDAVTVDFLNYWANQHCMDLGLYAKDLY